MQIEQPTDDQIRARACAIYLERGSQPGHDMDDWLQAEYELLKLPIHKIVDVNPPRGRNAKARQMSVVALTQLAVFIAATVLPELP